MRYKRYGNIQARRLLSVPFIWALIFPLVLLDLFVEAYHRVCFPLYDMPYVKRRQYIRMDRHKLQYLPLFDKLNCAYCSYAVGLLHYVSTIAAETETYWCGIKSQQTGGFVPPPHHDKFMEYGDATAFERECELGRKRKE